MNRELASAHEGIVPIVYGVFALSGTTGNLPTPKGDQLIWASPGVALFNSGTSGQRVLVRLETYDGPVPTYADGYEECAALDMTCPVGPMRILWDFSTPVDDLPPIEVPQLIHVQAWVTGRSAVPPNGGLIPDGTVRWLIRVSPSDTEPPGDRWSAAAEPAPS